MRSLVAQAAPLLALLLLGGCASPDHDAFAARDAAVPEGGAGGSADGGFIVDAAVDDASDGAQPDVLGDAGEDAPDPIEPDGPSRATFMHGLVDTGPIRICFHVRSAGVFEALDAPPLPDDPAGLGYARVLVIDGLDGVDLATSDVQPVVYSGALDALVGRSCTQLEGVAGVTRTPLQAIAAGTLSFGRSVLLVAAGCVGAPAHVDPAQEVICGKGYGPTHPTATLLVASMDRVTKQGAMSFQGFAASLASPPMTLRHRMSDEGKVTALATQVEPGVIAPHPPTMALAVDGLGDPQTSELWLSESAQSTPLGTIKLGDALGNGGLVFDELANEQAYTAVWVGPWPGTAEGAWWNPFAVTLVRSDRP